MITCIFCTFLTSNSTKIDMIEIELISYSSNPFHLETRIMLCLVRVKSKHLCEAGCVMHRLTKQWECASEDEDHDTPTQ